MAAEMITADSGGGNGSNDCGDAGGVHHCGHGWHSSADCGSDHSSKEILLCF